MSADRAERLYRAALARHDLRDVQPLYRKLLVKLKSADPASYAAAVGRYQESVVPRLAADEEDPVALWVEYGVWLAARVAPGRAVAVDVTGQARDIPETSELGPLLLHLPDETRVPAILLALPVEPSESQRATVELLCG